jgi:hypothetical protein
MFNSVLQYYSAENEFPDSTNICFNENYIERIYRIILK